MRKPFEAPLVGRPVHHVLRLAVAVVALVVFVGFQLVPGTWVPSDTPGTDKEWHAALYFGYALLLWWLLPVPPLSRALMILAFGLLTGVLMELLQDYVPGRNPDQADAVADMMGLGAATVALLVGRLVAPEAPGVGRQG
jgi:VanZ family protein